MRYAFYVIIISLILSSCYVLDNPFDRDGTNYRPGSGEASSTTTVENTSTTTVPGSTTTSSTTTTVPFGAGTHEAEGSGVALQGGSPVVRPVTGAEAVYGGFSGDGYVESFYPGASITFTVDIAVANTYDVDVRYAAGLSKAMRDANLYVNGSFVSLVQFPITAGWGTWGTKLVSISLNQGINTIEFRNEFTTDDLINFDSLAIP